MESDKIAGWIRAAIGYGIWFVAVLVVWRVVVSLDAVQRSGFAVAPFRTPIFPGGLPWVLFIDIAFLTVMLVSFISLGSRAREVLVAALPKLPRLGNVAYLIGVLIAVIVGYFAYDGLVVPPLYSQGVDWAYRLVFGLAVAGICIAIAFEDWQTALTLTKGRTPVITLPRQDVSGPQDQGSATTVCPRCGARFPQGAKYCSQCGVKVNDDRDGTKGGVDDHAT